MAQVHAPQRVAALGAAFDDLQARRFGRAAERCDRLLALDADDIDALLVLGLVAGACGDAVRAAALLQRVACARPDAEHPCRDLASLLSQSARPELIEPQYRASLHLAPDDARLRCAFADFLQEGGRNAEAVALLTDALRLRPAVAHAHNLIAVALADLGDTPAALAHLREAVALDPGDAGAWTNLGMLLKTNGQFDCSIAAHDTALSLRPDDPQLRVNRVVALLRAGRWTEGWRDYEWRLKLSGHPATPAPLLPALSTLPTLSGRTVLAVHEHGFGDTLQFARYLPLLAARGARIVAVVPRPLTRVMRSLAGVDAVLGVDDTLPAYDFVCPFCSLPRAFETTPDNVPAEVPYLHADPALAAAWSGRLPLGELRVGLAWAGQARSWLPGFSTLDGRRSLPLATLAPLARVPGVKFVSLQKGPAAAQSRAPPDGMVLFDAMEAADDFADTAAIIANLDLVVSVDTAVVHLAGALGKPVILLDRYDNCWRWLSGRTDSPWYPALRIFRQERIGAWEPVVRRVAEAVAAFAMSSRA